MIAASAYAFVTGRKVAGLFDHAAGRDLQVAAEARGERLQGIDGNRGAEFGGTLPELYDAGDEGFVSLEIDGAKARGFDRGSSGHYSLEVGEGFVQLYDHAEGAWFAFGVKAP